MGGMASTLSEACEKLKKMLPVYQPQQCSIILNNKTENYYISNQYIKTETSDGTTIKAGYDFNNSYRGYLPPNINCNKTILNSENFKDYISTASKLSQNRNSNLTELSNYSTTGYKLTNTSNYNYNNGLCNNSNQKYLGQFSSNYQTNFVFLTEKFNKKLNTDQKIKCKLDDFSIIKLLGRGTFGKVLLVRYKKDSQLYAMKVLNKYKLFKTNQIYHTKTEREILEKVIHPFIVKLHFAFQTEEKLYIVTEFMQGGELFYHLKKEKVFPEKKVKAYISEIVLALEHLHKNKIIYRDLKPENILLDIDGHIKLTDFGLSKYFNMVQDSASSCSDSSVNSEKAFTLCGTPEYLAPDILIGKGYDTAVDWWSLGVVMFEMLCGYSPFKQRKDRKLSFSYYKTPIEFKDDACISEEAKDIVLSFLKIDPGKRLYDTRKIKSHPFFKNVNWEDVLNKKCEHDFVPKNMLKSEEDVNLFDRIFTDSTFSDNETNYRKSKTNFQKNKNKLYDEFQNFSFVREDIIITS